MPSRTQGAVGNLDGHIALAPKEHVTRQGCQQRMSRSRLFLETSRILWVQEFWAVDTIRDQPDRSEVKQPSTTIQHLKTRNSAQRE